MWVGVIGWSIFMWMIVGALVVTLAVRSLALATLWQWFVVPTFGLAPLSYAAAAGLMLVAMVFQVGALSPDALVRASENTDDESRESTPLRTLLYKTLMDTVFMPLALLAVGWLIKGSL